MSFVLSASNFSMVNNVAAQVGDCNGRPSIPCEDHWYSGEGQHGYSRSTGAVRALADAQGIF